MAKDPAFLFYTNDFMSGTMFFSDDQLGKYLRILMAQHQHGHLSEKHMLIICKSYDEDILSKFQKDDAGLYYNKRLELEIDKRKAFSESRRNNAQNTKNKKVKNKKAYAKTSAKHMLEHMEDVNRDISIDISFDNFWNLYNKKTGRSKSQIRWAQLTVEEKTAIVKIVPAYVKSTPDDKYRKDPLTFLNARAWEDESLQSKAAKVQNEDRPPVDMDEYLQREPVKPVFSL